MLTLTHMLTSRVLDLAHQARTHHFNGKIATNPISHLIAIIDGDPALHGIIDAVNSHQDSLLLLPVELGHQQLAVALGQLL